MPGADQTDSLLRSVSFRAEKLLKARGHFRTVLWLAQYPNAQRQWFETPCVAPDIVTDAEALAALAHDTSLDFAEANVTAFAVGYLATRVIVTRPLDPDSSMRPKTERLKGVMLEAYDQSAPARGLFREIIALAGRDPTLGAPSERMPGPESPYGGVLQLAETFKTTARTPHPAGAQRAGQGGPSQSGRP